MKGKRFMVGMLLLLGAIAVRAGEVTYTFTSVSWASKVDARQERQSEYQHQVCNFQPYQKWLQHQSVRLEQI